jgi:GNAT superfamily N-acetyltransferase
MKEGAALDESRPFGPGDLGALAALCARSLHDPPDVSELEGALVAPDQPAKVFGDPSIAVVAVVECEDGPHVRLLVVDPAARGRGHGHALLDVAERWAIDAGHTTLTTGADPPYFLWPGAPITETGLLCLLERRRYLRVETNFDVDVDLQRIPDDPGGWHLAEPGERDEIDAWTGTHWRNWQAEVRRACDKGNLVLSRSTDEAREITAFCAFEVNRRGRLGPVAVRPDLIGHGQGRAVLIGALHELRRRGRDVVAVTWVGPVVPYAAVGGSAGEVFFVHRKELR